MNKKKNLLNLFTQDTSYNYHIIKTEEPLGHLIYLIKNGSEINLETLEFSPTNIAEELISEYEIKIEKFAPGVFFTEENNTEKLKVLLNNKLSENEKFSLFIEKIKDEYRILEIKDSLLFKKDPNAYEESKKKEHENHQKELWDEMLEKLKEKKNKREEKLMSYNNDIIKLMKDYFESIIEFEKNDFNWDSEFEKFVENLTDPETWIKIDNKPFNCKIKIVSLEKEKINVFLTDNNHLYTSSLKFNKTILVTENIVKIKNNLPHCMEDYEILSKLYNIDFTNTKEWEFKNSTERFKYVIDYFVPIFKLEKEKREKEIVEKILKEKEYIDKD